MPAHDQLVSEHRERTLPSQTLSRGLRVLEVLVEANRPLRVDEVATALGVHRSIVYRLLRTLEDHRLVGRDGPGRYAPGAGLSLLARGVVGELQEHAAPELARVADDLAMTSFLVIADRGECITVASVEPPYGVVNVAQRPGSRHPIERGAPGIALQMAGAGAPGRRDTAGAASGRDGTAGTASSGDARLAEAQARGYATSSNEVIPGLSALSVPLAVRAGRPAAIAVVWLTTAHRETEIADRLNRAAATIARALG